MSEYLKKSGQISILGWNIQNYLLLLLVIVFLVIYPPFIFVTFVSESMRLFIEIGIIFFLTGFILVKNKFQNDVLNIVPLLIIFIMLWINDSHTFNSLAYLFLKLIIFFLFINLMLSSSPIMSSISKGWFFFSSVLAIFTVLAYILFMSEIASFSPWEFSHGRYFLHHPFLGNIVMRHLFGIEVFSVPGFMFEGVYAGFFFGLNIIIARQIIEDRKKRNKFLILNSLAGFLTFSTTFFMFFIAYIFAKLINNINLPYLSKFLIWIFSIFILILLISLTDYFKYTSLEDRLINIIFAINVLVSSSIDEILFGNGFGFRFEGNLVTVDSGILRLILEQGLILTFFLIGIIFKYTVHNKYLLIFITLYSLSIPIFSFPFFYIFIALAYCAYSHKVNKPAVSF